jgi:hypothetical protein
MATLVNKNNREIKVIIPKMREFRTFYSDNEGVIGMFFKRDWKEIKDEPHWKPSEEQIAALQHAIDACECEWGYEDSELRSLLSDLLLL